MKFSPRLIVCLVLVALIVCSGSCVYAETTSQLLARLSAISQMLRQAEAAEQSQPDTATQLLRSLSTSIPETVRIQTADGRSVNTDLGFIRSEVNSLVILTPSTRINAIRDLANSVDALRGEVSASQTAFRPGNAAARRTLRKVLAETDYRPSFLEIWQARILRAIAGALGNLSVAPQIGEVITWILLAVLLVVVVYLVIYLFVRGFERRSLRIKREAQNTPRNARKVSPKPEAIIEQAQNFAARGMYKEAFRSVYLASILTLDRAKLVKYADGVTNREYLYSLRARETNEAYSLFDTLTSSFDLLIYGTHEVAESDYLTSLRQFKSLEAAI